MSATDLRPATPSLAVPAARTMWLILAAVLIADVLDLLDSTLTIIAAPTIAADLGGGAGLIKWLGSAYALALGSLLVVGGRIGDRYGQRPTFLIGITGFTLASLLCGLAPTPEVLIAGRLLQGASGALLIPQGFAIMISAFPRPMLEKAFSAFGPILALTIVCGPIVGAFIINADIAGLGWRPMFLINIVLGSIGLALAWKVLPRTKPDGTVVLDGLGAGLLVATMLCVIYSLIEGSTSGWSPLVAGIGVGGIACLIAFGGRQRVAPNPLIEPSLLKNRGFTAGLVMALAFFAVVSGLGYVLSLFLQQGTGRTPVETALTGIAPMAAGIMVASPGGATDGPPRTLARARWVVRDSGRRADPDGGRGHPGHVHRDVVAGGADVRDRSGHGLLHRHPLRHRRRRRGPEGGGVGKRVAQRGAADRGRAGSRDHHLGLVLGGRHRCLIRDGHLPGGGGCGPGRLLRARDAPAPQGGGSRDDGWRPGLGSVRSLTAQKRSLVCTVVPSCNPAWLWRIVEGSYRAARSIQVR